MAELKVHDWAYPYQSFFHIFHGITAVAELKVELRIPGYAADEIFHGITAVAELKESRAGGRQGDPQHFPRHHRRGRIEGARSGTKSSTLADFPRHRIAVAELKLLYNEAFALAMLFHGIEPPWPN